MFDYNCGYCRQALPDLATLLAEDPNLRGHPQGIPDPVAGLGRRRARRPCWSSEANVDYWTFHQTLFTSRGQVTRPIGAAGRAGPRASTRSTLELDMNAAERSAEVIDKSYQHRRQGSTSPARPPTSSATRSSPAPSASTSFAQPHRQHAGLRQGRLRRDRRLGRLAARLPLPFSCISHSRACARRGQRCTRHEPWPNASSSSTDPTSTCSAPASRRPTAHRRSPTSRRCATAEGETLGLDGRSAGSPTIEGELVTWIQQALGTLRRHRHQSRRLLAHLDRHPRRAPRRRPAGRSRSICPISTRAKRSATTPTSPPVALGVICGLGADGV